MKGIIKILPAVPFLVLALIVVVIVLWERRATALPPLATEISTETDVLAYTFPVRNFTFQFDPGSAVFTMTSNITRSIYTVTGNMVLGGPENLKKMLSWTIAGGTDEVVPPAHCQDVKISYQRTTKTVTSIVCI